MERKNSLRTLPSFFIVVVVVVVAVIARSTLLL